MTARAGCHLLNSCAHVLAEVDVSCGFNISADVTFPSKQLTVYHDVCAAFRLEALLPPETQTDSGERSVTSPLLHICEGAKQRVS